jgi:rhodanese-related sulfurtransferase
MPIPEITPEALSEKLKLPKEQRPILLDVRRPEEHAYVALPESKLMPLYELSEHVDELEALAEKEVVVYCHHGFRSLQGAAFLIDLGIKATSLAGGIERYAEQVDPSLRRY